MAVVVIRFFRQEDSMHVENIEYGQDQGVVVISSRSIENVAFVERFIADTIDPCYGDTLKLIRRVYVQWKNKKDGMLEPNLFLFKWSLPLAALSIFGVGGFIGATATFGLGVSTLCLLAWIFKIRNFRRREQRAIKKIQCAAREGSVSLSKIVVGHYEGILKEQRKKILGEGSIIYKRRAEYHERAHAVVRSLRYFHRRACQTDDPNVHQMVARLRQSLRELKAAKKLLGKLESEAHRMFVRSDAELDRFRTLMGDYDHYMIAQNICEGAEKFAQDVFFDVRSIVVALESTAEELRELCVSIESQALNFVSGRSEYEKIDRLGAESADRQLFLEAELNGELQAVSQLPEHAESLTQRGEGQ